MRIGREDVPRLPPPLPFPARHLRVPLESCTHIPNLGLIVKLRSSSTTGNGDGFGRLLAVAGGGRQATTAADDGDDD